MKKYAVKKTYTATEENTYYEKGFTETWFCVKDKIYRELCDDIKEKGFKTKNSAKKYIEDDKSFKTRMDITFWKIDYEIIEVEVMTVKELIEYIERANELLTTIGKNKLELLLNINCNSNKITCMKDFEHLSQQYFGLDNKLRDDFLNKEYIEGEIITLNYGWYDGKQKGFKIRISLC